MNEIEPRKAPALPYATSLLNLLSAILLLFSCQLSAANTTIAHAIALHGQPKYPENFNHFDYVNPDAPKGGSISLMASGTFDTLNPYTLKGISPMLTPSFYLYGISELNEPLMVGTSNFSPSGDEPQTAYGLIAESIEYPEDRRWAIFTLRPQARFHDGTAITADDVLFSFHTLVEQGHPRFQHKYADVEKVEKLADNRVKFSFKGEDTRAMPLRAAELPILSKAFWQGRDFTKTLSEPPLGSGPYRVKSFELGRFITFERVADYWGKDLAINRGSYNFDQVRFDFYRDLLIAFEAFKAAEFDFYMDYTAKNWAQGYDFPAYHDGRVLKEKIPHRQAYGYQAFFLNSRREVFKDVRVREALGLLFDYEWMNKALFYGAYKRNDSYFPNTSLGADGKPTASELEILAPYRSQLTEKLFTDAFIPPKTNGSGVNRNNVRQALRLFASAGWQIKNNQLIHQQSGEQFRFEALFDDPRSSKIILPFKRNLARAGIELEPRLVDPTQYKSRKDNFDYDMIIEVLPQSLSPGYELREYFHSEQVGVNGARNYSGVKHPVVDALVEQAVAANDRNILVNTVRALDRVLLWHHYSIPQWHAGYHRAAWWNKFGRPAVTPPYAFNFRNWWIASD